MSALDVSMDNNLLKKMCSNSHKLIEWQIEIIQVALGHSDWHSSMYKGLNVLMSSKRHLTWECQSSHWHFGIWQLGHMFLWGTLTLYPYYTVLGLFYWATEERICKFYRKKSVAEMCVNVNMLFIVVVCNHFTTGQHHWYTECAVFSRY